jgi:hypothetical protein
MMHHPMMSLRWVLLFCLAPGWVWAGPLDTLAPGEWYEVPNSHLSTQDPCPARNCSYSGASGQASVIAAWSSAGFDTARDRLVVWGGGHGDYGGNELYVFDLGTLAWSRITSPSDPPGQDVPYAPDGQPTSRHTYDYVQYVPAIDSFCSFGGAAFYLSGQTGTAHTDCFNFASAKWEQHPDDPTLGEFIGSFSAVDPVTGHAWAHGCMSLTSLAEFDPVANAWISHGGTWTDQNNYYNYYLTGSVAPDQRRLVAVGANQAFTFDLSDAGTTDAGNDIIGVPLTTGGTQAIVQAQSPGFEYDPVSHLFVAWNGGADVYTLDPSTWAWTQVPPAATNTVTPTAANAQGTNGRFRYSPAHNVFVVVNSVDEDVFIYRFTADGGGLADAGSTPDAGRAQDGGGTGTPDEGSPGKTAGSCGCTAIDPALGPLALLLLSWRGSGSARRSRCRSRRWRWRDR